MNKIQISTTTWIEAVRQEALKLLLEEFPEHSCTDIRFYKWVFVAWHNDRMVGLVTANKFLPDTAILCDIAVKKEYRSKGVGMKLIGALLEALEIDEYTYLTGMTPIANRAALRTYQRFHVGQEPMTVTNSHVKTSLAQFRQIEQRLEQRRIRNKNRTT